MNRGCVHHLHLLLLLLLCLSDLASYVPKHAMDFSAWQEHKHSNSISTQEDGSGPQAELTQEVMVSLSRLSFHLTRAPVVVSNYR